MLRFGKILIALCISFFVLSSTLYAEGKQHPAGQATAQLLDLIKQIGDKSSKTPDEISKLCHLALNYMDMKFISQKVLEKHRDKLSAKEQEQFQNLLSDLFIHVAFPNSGKFFSGLDIHFEKTFQDKTIATTPVLVVHKDEGEVDIEFKLQLTNEKWKVIDVDLDGISMRNNLRSQIYKILQNDDFAELSRRMTKKLDEAKNES